MTAASETMGRRSSYTPTPVSPNTSSIDPLQQRCEFHRLHEGRYELVPTRTQSPLSLSSHGRILARRGVVTGREIAKRIWHPPGTRAECVNRQIAREPSGPLFGQTVIGLKDVVPGQRLAWDRSPDFALCIAFGALKAVLPHLP